MNAPEASPRKLRVILIDDHPVLRQGLELVISQHLDIEVVGQGGTARRRSMCTVSTGPTRR